MRNRSFPSTVVTRSWWIGLAVLFPMGAVMLATAVWAEVGQGLFGLAGLACAACADPSNGIGTGGAVGGVVGAGTAVGGAGAGGGTTGTGETGGVNVGRDDRTLMPPASGGPAGDATRDDWRPPRPAGSLQNVSNWVQDMTESITGTDPTVARPMTRN